MSREVILIFDIGKTNKKYFLFDKNFSQLDSEYIIIPEIKDDDGFACDDLLAIENWMLSVYKKIVDHDSFEISFINISAYGATLVHLDEFGNPCTALYSYLKEFPEDTKQLFTQKYGDLNIWSRQTASPFLGMLNAGLQLFWLKYRKPELFKKIHTTLFLPQYLSSRFSGKYATEFTSVGCHTGLWDFENDDYHIWVSKESFLRLLPEIQSSNTSHTIAGTRIKVAIGIHDSSAALIPYLNKYHHPFILLSTGTWSICFNPFNSEPLTDKALTDDCLCYMRPDGKQVKASRLFIGYEFTKWVKNLNEYFNLNSNHHHLISFNKKIFEGSKKILSPVFIGCESKDEVYFHDQPLSDLSWFYNYEEAYHLLIKELVEKQVQKINLVIGTEEIKTIYIDGGFANNKVFVGAMKEYLPCFNIIATELPLGTSLGAALVTQYLTN